jgi:hypothetical protein
MLLLFGWSCLIALLCSMLAQIVVTLAFAQGQIGPAQVGCIPLTDARALGLVPAALATAATGCLPRRLLMTHSRAKHCV